MTVSATAPSPEAERFKTQALAGAGISFSAFVFGFIWFFAADSQHVDNAVVMWGLSFIATVQAVSGIWAVVAAIKARRRLGLPLALTFLTVLTGFFFGALGVIGVPLFLMFRDGVSIGMSGWGRPLRVKGKLLHPEIRASKEWARGERPVVTSLNATTREVLAALWLQDAQKEYGSVPAFSRIGWQLAGLGAPAELAERAYKAALQEIDHARRCFALVEAYAGKPTGVMPMPELLADQPGMKSLSDGFIQVAKDSLLDGCLIEDLNADAAAYARDRAKEPAVLGVLDQIAREEREHADLAWSILEFCVERGGEPVRRAIAEELERLPSTGPIPYDDALAPKVDASDASQLEAHGRVPVAMWPVLFAERRARTIERVRELLSPALRNAA